MTKQEVISALETRITENLTAIDVDSRYDEMLNEIYSFESVGGPFEHMQPSRVLAENDPTAYRCGKVDWIDGEDFVEIQGDYYDEKEVEAERDAFVSDLDSEREDLEAERDELAEALTEEQTKDEPDTDELANLAEQIAEKEKEMKATEDERAIAERHTF